MAVQLNHSIIWSDDPVSSATFLTRMFGLSAPKRFGLFQVVNLSNGASLDFAKSKTPVQSQHYAFLVTEPEFDAVLARIHEEGVEHWADPFQRETSRINHQDGGRGVYFANPDGHLLEAITRPYSSSGD